MEAIGFAFNDFDSIIHPFQDSRMNRVATMEALAKLFKGIRNLLHKSLDKRIHR